MDNKEFKDLFHQILKPLGFRRKGNFWTLETNELVKIINLQKSNFSNKYYINFGYNIKNLHYDGVSMHIFGRLQEDEIFDLDIPLSRIERASTLKQVIENDLLIAVNKVNNEGDLIDILEDRPHLNNIPLKVKDYLKIKN